MSRGRRALTTRPASTKRAARRRHCPSIVNMSHTMASGQQNRGRRTSPPAMGCANLLRTPRRRSAPAPPQRRCRRHRMTTFSCWAATMTRMAGRSADGDFGANVRDMSVGTQRTRRPALCTLAHCSTDSQTRDIHAYLRDKSDAVGRRPGWIRSPHAWYRV
jgi:hypothetical protein